MQQFRKLFKLLEKEFVFQEQLLGLLTKERVAIVKLNQDQIDQIRDAKTTLLTQAAELGDRRNELLQTFPIPDDAEQLSFAHIVEQCPVSEGKADLIRIGKSLKELTYDVRELNDQNAALIRQSLGLIASTVSILRSSPESDLPTYGKRGALKSGKADQAFTARNGMVREA